MKYYETLDEATRERLFAVMRKLGDEELKLAAEHQRLQPPYGTVGIGSADFDPFLKAEVLGTFLRRLRRGDTPEEAHQTAKAAGRLAVELWNTRGCRARVAVSGKFELERWNGSGDATADRALRETLAATKSDH